MKPTYTEQLAKLQLDRIAKRKAFWKTFREVVGFIAIVALGVAALLGLACLAASAEQWFRTQTALRARVEALEGSVSGTSGAAMDALNQVAPLRAMLDEQKAQIQKLQTPPVNNWTVPYTVPTQPFYWTNFYRIGTNDAFLLNNVKDAGTVWITNTIQRGWITND